MRWTLVFLLFATRAHAQAPVIEEPTWNAGMHVGPGYLYGDETLQGMSIAGRLEVGRYVRSDLALELTLGMNPPISHDPGVYGDGPTGRQSFFLGVVGEYHVDDFFAGVGAGAVRETTGFVRWGHDGIGPTDPRDYTYERFGAIALARAGLEKVMTGRFFFTITLEALVMRVAATEDVMPTVWSYAGSLDVGVRYRW